MQVPYRGKTLMNHSKNPNTVLSIMIALAVVGVSSTAEATEPAPVCGNGEVEEGEECDDDNTQNGDGCDEDCQEEEGEEPVCGNDILEEGEECDDGNTENEDGCDEECNLEDCRVLDEDDDGVNDCDDRCPGTEAVPETLVPTEELKPNHYALTDAVIMGGNDPFKFDTFNPKEKAIEDSNITLADTGGCTCEQILDAKPGNNEGQYKFGCSEGTIKNAIKDAQGAPPEGDEMNVNDPPKMDCNMGGQASNGAAWALFGLVLAAFSRRRRS
jgi:MYXO-CTERM domain-containing protein